MNQDYILYTLLIIVVALTILTIWLFTKVRSLSRGNSGQSLEEHIATILQEHEKNTRLFDDTKNRLTNLESKMKSAIRHVQAIRFDPLDGMGDGKQSFTLAILDEEGNGAVISSLNARDRMRVFAKPIQNFSSPHELSDEEKRAIAKK